MSYKEGPRRPLPAIQQGERQHVTVGTLTITNNLSLQSPDGGAAMGGIAAHGYVNGKAGTARQGGAKRTSHGRTSVPGALKQLRKFRITGFRQGRSFSCD